MSNILSIKRRISAAQNVSKTTRAMQMIAATKLKRAQNITLASKPYVEKITYLSQNLIERLDEENLHPYMKKPKNAEKDLIIILSPDKGLCGGLISNLTKKLIDIDTDTKNPVYITVGKKIEKIVSRLKREMLASFKMGSLLPPFDIVYPITSIIDQNFLANKVGGVKILSARFTSIFTQTIKLTNILPMELPQQQEEKPQFTLPEPNIGELLPVMLKRYLEMSIYQFILEAYASEQGARMIAMQSATDNALDIIQSLKLEYNKERQEKITNEILDISGGAFTYAY